MLRYSGDEADLEAFLADNPTEDVVLMFDLSPERAATLGREIETRKFNKSVVGVMDGGTTVVQKIEVTRQVVLKVPSEEPTDAPAFLQDTQLTADPPDLPQA